MAIRPAHTVSIIQKRLKQAESADVVDAMELIGIVDELTRVERKWLQKAADLDAGDRSKRPLADADQMNERFERLTRLFDTALRRGIPDPAERLLIEKYAALLHTRSPIQKRPKNIDDRV